MDKPASSGFFAAIGRAPPARASVGSVARAVRGTACGVCRLRLARWLERSVRSAVKVIGERAQLVDRSVSLLCQQSDLRLDFLALALGVRPRLVGLLRGTIH